MFHLIKQLWNHLEAERQRHFKYVLFLMILASFAEVISIGSVLPFLTILTDPNKILEMQSLKILFDYFHITNSNQLLLPVTIFFIFVVVLSSAIRVALLYVIQQLSMTTGHDIGIKIYSRTLYQDFEIHNSRNTSEVISGIIKKTDTVVGHVITPILNIVSSLILFIGIISTLIYINPRVTLFGFVIFGLIYMIISKITKKRLRKNSNIISIESNKTIKAIQEGLGGIRDVLIDGSQKFYCNLYKDADIKLRTAAANNEVISGSPKYIMEGLGIVFIALLAFVLSQTEESFLSSIPMLGVLAIGAQKTLPVLQQSYNAISSVRGNEASLIDVLELLNQKESMSKIHDVKNLITFNESILLNNVSFSYSGNKTELILKDISFKIPKESHIGFIGETGCGKSTLFDLIMGLLNPVSGTILVDGIDINNNIGAWQRNISHVPQDVFLIDGSVKDNIAFGVLGNDVDMDLVKKSAYIARISETVEGWDNGYETFVGERGVKLSGGQRQRIGIARALYKQTSVIIFDEATSALDAETEKQVMKNIGNLAKDITILSIAHRITSLSMCDSIIRVGKGKDFKIMQYKDLMSDKVINKRS